MDEACGCTEGADEQECSVCMERLKDPMCIQACGHIFCKLCLNKSLKQRPHCPFCRGDASGKISPVARTILATRGAKKFPKVYDSRSLQWFPRFLRSSSGRLNSSQSIVEQSHLAVLTDEGCHSTPNPAPSSNPRFAPVSAAGRNAHRPPAVQPTQAQAEVTNEHEHLCELLEVMWLSPHGSSSSVTVFSCPYCQEGGLDQLDLLNHCNIFHEHETTPVVCPICVTLPHGDPSYYSRNFIGHLNLRHCFYTEDFTNIRQTDAVNQQAVLLESYKRSTPNRP